MRKKDDLDKYYESLIEVLNSQENCQDFPNYFYNSYLAGNNHFYQKNITETKFFDEEWITTLESYFPSIDRIIAGMRSTIRYEEEVVLIEKARKINSASVRHLASHTQLIRSVDDGEVTPKKILTTYAEEEFGTYENRFIKTLIERLVLFVENRYLIIKDNVESYQKEHFAFNSIYDIEDTKVTFDIDMVIKKDLDNKKVNLHNYELLERVEKLRKSVLGFHGSNFMRTLEKAKKVHAPILKTNIILKNPDFRNAYTLWLFIDRYNSLGYDVDIKERPVHLSRKFGKDVNRIALMTYSMVQNNLQRRKELFEDTNDFTEYRRKSTKIAKTNPKDFVKNPDEIMIVDNTINEYYLEKYRRTFTKRMKDYALEVSSKPAILRKSLNDTINISNSLYESIFNLEEDETDIFRRLVKESDPRQDYETAKEKARFAKVIREVKESDYKKALKLEKALMKNIERANIRMIRIQNIRKKKATLDEISKRADKQIAKWQKERKKAQGNIVLIDEKTKEITVNRELMQQELEKINSRTKEEIKRITLEEKEKLKVAIAQAQEQLNNKINTVIEKERALIEKEKLRYETRIANEKAKQAEMIAKAKKKEAEKKAKLLAQAKEKNNDALKKAEAKKQEKVAKTITQFEAKLNSIKNNNPNEKKENKDTED